MDRVVISEQEEGPPATGFERRHPVLSYLFGDMVKGLYVVGCLALDLFLPAQLRLSFPGQDLTVIPSAGAAVILLLYAEIRLYGRLWPRRQRKIVKAILDRHP